jgi:DNA-binding NtrC family response regulator
VVTGYARKADAALARRCGAHRFFLKPLLPASLLQEIESVFAHLKEGRQPVWNGPSGAWDRRLRRRSTDGER